MLDPFRMEALTARSARLARVAGDGYAIWLDHAAEGLKDAVRATRDLTACRTPADLARLQLGWIEAASRRHAGILRATLDYAGALAAARDGVPGQAAEPPVPAPPSQAPLVPEAPAAPVAEAAVPSPVAPPPEESPADPEVAPEPAPAASAAPESVPPAPAEAAGQGTGKAAPRVRGRRRTTAADAGNAD